MGGGRGEGFPSPFFPPVGHLSKHQQSTPKRGRNLVQSLQVAPPFWRAAWHLREAAPTMGGKKQRGKQKHPFFLVCYLAPARGGSDDGGENKEENRLWENVSCPKGEPDPVEGQKREILSG
jgi:hypothetical protein